MDVSNIEGIYPLTPAQHGMLFYTLAAPESGVYFEQFPLNYTAGIDPAVFAAAWQQVVDRNPILRTSFLWEGLEAPVQVVHRNVRLPVEQLDWRDRSPEEQQRDLAALARADRRRGFDLTRPPLLRITLIRFGEDVYRGIWSHHHLLLDGWSVGLMMRELVQRYTAIARGETPALPERRPFKDFIGWLRQRDTTAAETYWRRVLAGFRTPTPLPVRRTCADGLPLDYELRLIRLTPERTAQLKSFAQQNRLTPSTLIYGAWALFLARTSGARDIVFGTTTSGRSPALAGVESMMGCLINTLPVRVPVDPEAGLVPWLQALQKNLLELRQSEQTPLADVLGWADLPRRQPLFESLVILESFTAEASFNMTHNGFFQRSHYPLTLVSSLDPVVTLRLGYEPDRVPEALALRILEDLETLLTAMIEDPARRLGSFLLPGSEAPPSTMEEEIAPAARIPPRTDTEREIAALWQQLLKVDEVGAEDDFFDLGGHSLLLLRMADKVRAAKGRELPWERLLACRTVAEVAGVVGERASSLSASGFTDPESLRSAGDAAISSGPG